MTWRLSVILSESEISLTSLVWDSSPTALNDEMNCHCERSEAIQFLSWGMRIFTGLPRHCVARNDGVTKRFFAYGDEWRFGFARDSSPNGSEWWNELSLRTKWSNPVPRLRNENFDWIATPLRGSQWRCNKKILRATPSEWLFDIFYWNNYYQLLTISLLYLIFLNNN